MYIPATPTRTFITADTRPISRDERARGPPSAWCRFGDPAGAVAHSRRLCRLPDLARDLERLSAGVRRFGNVSVAGDAPLYRLGSAGILQRFHASPASWHLDMAGRRDAVRA